MDALEFENMLCELLDQDGWIEHLERDLQDLHIEWTARGRELGERFVEEVCALRPDPAWSDEDLAHLRSLGVYFGFIEATRRDRTLQATRPFTAKRNLLVVTTSPKSRRRYRLFTARDFEGFYDYLEGEQDAGREIMLIAIDDILGSSVGRAFPFGSKDPEGSAI